MLKKMNSFFLYLSFALVLILSSLDHMSVLVPKEGRKETDKSVCTGEEKLLHIDVFLPFIASGVHCPPLLSLCSNPRT